MIAKRSISLTVNGVRYEATVEPRLTLVDLLRAGRNDTERQAPKARRAHRAEAAGSPSSTRRRA